MTAMNCVVTENAAHLFTDGAIYDLQNNGELIARGSKSIALPHLNAAIASTGFTYVNHLINAAILDTKIAAFDELVLHFADIVHDAERRSKSFSGISDWSLYRSVLIGWSEENNQPQAYYLGPGLFGKMATSAQRIRRFTTPWPRELAEPQLTGDMDADAVALMEAQRELKAEVDRVDTDGSFIVHPVGCFCQRTTVDRDGISMKILKRWDDVVGEPIIPKAVQRSSGKSATGADSLFGA